MAETKAFGNYSSLRSALYKHAENMGGSRCPLDLSVSILSSPSNGSPDIRRIKYAYEIHPANNSPALAKLWLKVLRSEHWIGFYGEDNQSLDQHPLKVIETLGHIVDLGDLVASGKRNLMVNGIYPLDSIKQMNREIKDYLSRFANHSPADLLKARIQVQENIIHAKPEPIIKYAHAKQDNIYNLVKPKQPQVKKK
ncbi:MAG: hypothetical protein WCK90_01900 [archaeon]